MSRNIYRSKRIIPVLSRLEDLETFLNNNYKHIPLVLKYNTGLNRLGIPTGDVEKSIELLKKYKRTHITHLMSHFSSSFLSIERGQKTNTQFKLFKELKRTLNNFGITVEKVLFLTPVPSSKNLGLKKAMSVQV